jgi:hypothetical protein
MVRRTLYGARPLSGTPSAPLVIWTCLTGTKTGTSSSALEINITVIQVDYIMLVFTVIVQTARDRTYTASGPLVAGCERAPSGGTSDSIPNRDARPLRILLSESQVSEIVCCWIPASSAVLSSVPIIAELLKLQCDLLEQELQESKGLCKSR